MELKTDVARAIYSAYLELSGLLAGATGVTGLMLKALKGSMDSSVPEYMALLDESPELRQWIKAKVALLAWEMGITPEELRRAGDGRHEDEVHGQDNHRWPAGDRQDHPDALPGGAGQP